MLIWIDEKLNTVYIKIESDHLYIDDLLSQPDHVLLSILKTKGWNFCDTSITCKRIYQSKRELIKILKEIDVSSDGIEEILHNSISTQT